jgi:hypothetical protein
MTSADADVSIADPRARRASLAVLLAFAIQAVYFTGLYPPFWNPNELSRFQTITAMAERGTFSIDREIELLGDHEDKAAYGGRSYSNKAPGLAFAAYPAYRVLRLVLPEPTRANVPPMLWILRLATVSLICFAALRRLAKRLRESAPHPGAAPLVLCAAALGTPFVFYARSFFSHAFAAALLFLAWNRLKRAEESLPLPDARPLLSAAIAGLCAGWAAISEYTVAPLAALLFVRAVARPDRRRLAGFVLGAAVPLGLLLWYDAVCFGSPFSLSSAHEADPAYAALAGRGAFGLGLPSLSVAASLLVHPARGVLVLSPFLLWIVPGLIAWWRSRRDRADCAFVGASIAVFVLVVAAYPNWHGGWSLGSRYLLPVALIAALPIVRALATPLSRGLFLAAALYSVATHFLLAATFPHLPLDQAWPAATTSAWFLARGWAAQSLATVYGAGAAASLVMPALCEAAAIALAARAAAPVRPAAPIALLLGAAPLAALLLRPPELSYRGRLWRASALGAFSGRDPARRELRSVVLDARTPEEMRRAAATWRVYGAPGEPGGP